MPKVKTRPRYLRGTNRVNAVLAMNPLIYNYKGNPASQKAIGFVAQDMRKVVPEVVHVPKDPNGMMGIW